jgi:histidine ammonia-lyase
MSPGFYSGLMLSQYTADHLIVEQRILSAPASSIQSIPAAADQEDFVSMGMNTALKNGQILDNAYGVLGNRIYGGRASAGLSASSLARAWHSKSARSDPQVCGASRSGSSAV